MSGLCREHGIASPPIFHKKPLDSSLPGHALPADVASAIADVTRWPLVTCVLNTIDDALDRVRPRRDGMDRRRRCGICCRCSTVPGTRAGP